MFFSLALVNFIVAVFGSRDYCNMTFPASATSLQQARKALSSILQESNGALSSDLSICLLPGAHSVTAHPHALDASHSVRSGPGRVVWRGVGPGVQISGGAQVVSWVQGTLGGGDVYVAPVPGAVAPGSIIRNLWVAGVRASRTSISQPSSFLRGMKPWVGADSVGYTVGAVPSSWLFNGTTAIEFTYPIVVKNWISPRCTVASILGLNITLASPCGLFLHSRQEGAALVAPAVIEAAPVFPLAPGTFFHDVSGGALYYALASGQSAADLATSAFIAAQEVLLDAVNVSGHVYQGLQFVFGSWSQVNTRDGYVDTQAAVYECSPGSERCATGLALPPGISTASGSGVPTGSAEPLGNVRVSGGENCAFEGCTFAHLGAAYALSVMGGSHAVQVFNNTFYDLSGGFLKLGSINPTGHAGSADPADWDSFAAITHNVASNLAKEYDGAAGYFGGFLFSARVEHNTVSDAGYSGFSQGWGAS
jgi:hypothetical protein